MVDQTQPKTSSPKSKIATVVLLASAAIAPFTMSSEGTVYKAYRDPIGKVTICNGHTGGVKMGDTATKAQCLAYLQKDLAIAMDGVVRSTPEIVDNQHALEAAGDFTLNSGAGGWTKSPMAANFSRKDWVAGCNSFVGYYAAGTFDKPNPSYECRPKPGRPGKYLCNLPGLVTRRINEKKICLGMGKVF